MRSLRITTSDGVVVHDPGPDEIAGVLRTAEREGTGAFVVLDGDTTGDAPFMQAMYLGLGEWRVEICAVRPEPRRRRPRVDQYWTLLHDVSTVAAAFWSWADNGTDWQALAWQHQPPETLWQRRSQWAAAAGV